MVKPAADSIRLKLGLKEVADHTDPFDKLLQLRILVLGQSLHFVLVVETRYPALPSHTFEQPVVDLRHQSRTVSSKIHVAT